MISKDWKKEMRRIIKIINQGDENLDITNNFTAECLATCIDKEYIIGYSYDRNALGNPMFDHINPKVTQEGMLFIENKSPNRSANIAIIISVFALLISLLSNLEKIIASVIMLLKLAGLMK